MLAGLAALVLAAALSNDPVSYDFSPQAEANGAAHLTVNFNMDDEDVKITIEGDDGSKIEKTVAHAKEGQHAKVAWTQNSQAVHYEMTLQGTALSGTFSFDVIKATGGSGGKAAPLKFKSTRADIVERRKVRYQTPFALASYEYSVIDADGSTIASDTVTTAVPAGGTFTVSWDDPSPVFMIEVRGEGQRGRFATDRRVPYSAEIPHTEVTFDSGKAIIKPDQKPLLDEAVAAAIRELDKLDRVNEAVNAELTTQLYIVGYTDTVGKADKNETLSRDRAKAIAKYFHDHGVWAEIHYAGMGERGLRVETDDNVDEVRNRRALYLIAFDRPAAGGPIPGRWTKLSDARPRPAGLVVPPK